MDISLIMKACGVGMLVAVASQVLGKSGREDMASLVSLAGVILVLMMLVGEVGALLERVREVFGL
jgi:stage III sporulation protein AC